MKIRRKLGNIFGAMSDEQRANMLMRLAWKRYDEHSALVQRREMSSDRIERMVLSHDVAAIYLLANNTAREAERFFNRCHRKG